MTDQPKPKLLPVTVPWQIDAGAPYLSLQMSAKGEPVSATFVAYFKKDDIRPKGPSSTVEIAGAPAAFEARSLDKPAAFRLVRISFIDGLHGHTKQAVADHEVVKEADFDWTAIASTRRPGESVEETVRRSRNLWLMSGICPDPAMYDVQESPWIRALGLAEQGWHHYLLLGHDEYVEVVAKGWTWEAGQPVS